VNNATTFTTRDLRTDCVRYQHDNSENFRDSFDFIASSQRKSTSRESNEYTGTFDIYVSAINDNYPQRVVERVLYVVSNNVRPVTLDDIYFRDADTDQDDSNLVYTIRDSVPNGEFVLASNRSIAVRQFIQEDLENRNIYFKHGNRLARGKFLVTVSDGSFETKSILEVEASDGFVSVANNTGLEVRRGQLAVLHVTNLTIVFNMDVPDRDVNFSVNIPPRYGRLLRNKHATTRFSLAELKNAIVSYHHDGSDSQQDSIGLLIKVG
jgi:hypothetical protein